jgi:hypothetical protein
LFPLPSIDFDECKPNMGRTHETHNQAHANRPAILLRLQGVPKMRRAWPLSWLWPPSQRPGVASTGLALREPRSIACHVSAVRPSRQDVAGMSDMAAKLYPPQPQTMGRARATLKQLSAMWGKIEPLAVENGKPTRIRLHGMDSSSVWRKLDGGDVWEMET